jgi:paraquat-inducible protein B
MNTPGQVGFRPLGSNTEPIELVKGPDIKLFTPKLGSLQPPSPVFHRDIQVGEVLDCRLSDDAREVVIHALNREEYAPLVCMNSKQSTVGFYPIAKPLAPAHS